MFDHWIASCEPDEEKQPGDYFTAPYIWNENDVVTITVTAYWRDALILLNDDSAQPAGSKNADIIAANNGKTDQTVVLSGRTLYKDGSWNTLCLPFPMNAEQLAASPLAGDGLKLMALNFTTVYDGTDHTDNLQAGTPYIIKWVKAEGYDDASEDTRDIKNPVFTGVTIEHSAAAQARMNVNTADTKVTFTGTYASQTFNDEDKSILFMGEANTLYYPLSGATIGAQRAYFLVNDTNNGTGEGGGELVKAFVLNFDGTTGINSLTPDPSPVGEGGAGAWYDLNGRRLNGVPTQKGIYVSNGKKVVIK